MTVSEAIVLLWQITFWGFVFWGMNWWLSRK